MKNILLIIDPQNDFISGTLAVPNAPEKMLELTNYLKEKIELYDYVCITLDSHTKEHCSFTNNGGIWPEHCIRYELGWHLPKYLTDVLNKYPNVKYYHKGTDIKNEEYSIFNNQQDGQILKNLLLELSKKDQVFIDICGIAGDYCVLETLKGLLEFIPSQYISVLNEFTVSIDGGNSLKVYMENKNINLIVNSSLNLTEYVR